MAKAGTKTHACGHIKPFSMDWSKCSDNCMAKESPYIGSLYYVTTVSGSNT